MSDKPKPPDLSELPPAERAARYRELAAEALERAQAAGGEDIRQSYRLMAEQWNKLAADLEREGPPGAATRH